MAIPTYVLELLAAQGGVVGLWQLQPADRRPVRRPGEGPWKMITDRVAFFGHHEPDDNARLWAAVLHGGAEARLAGHAALILHGWSQQHTAPHHITVPQHVSVPAHRLLVAHRVRHNDGPDSTPPRVGVHDAVIQAAAWARTNKEAVIIVISALQQRLTHAARLLELLEQRPRLKRRALIIEAVEEFESGIHSANEQLLVRVCARHNLPAPVRQVVQLDHQGRRRSIDAEFQTASGGTLRVEVQGLHHLNPDQRILDIRRRNSLVLGGDSPHLEVLSWELRYEPLPFVNDLRYGIYEAKIA